MPIRSATKVCFIGLVTLAAFGLLYPHKGAADTDNSVDGGVNLTRTLKMDNKSEEWEAIVRKLSIQREQQIAQQKTAELERQKAEALAKAVEAAKPKVVAIPKQTPVVPITGTKTEWMKAAGIPESQWALVDSIVTRESGWNPNAVNRSSGACGLGQQLPCGKWAGAWNDPVAALIAMTGYVNSRYGGWAGAVAFWNSHHWY